MLIFGNGNQPLEDIEPQPTRGIFGDLFGLGPFFKMLSDPAMLASAQAMMGAITAGGEAAQRLEAKLDLLLKGQGYDVEALNREYAENAQSTVMLRSAIAALPASGADAGMGGNPPASLALDHGHSADAARDRPPAKPHGRGHRGTR